jgi:hypothetical protein
MPNNLLTKKLYQFYFLTFLTLFTFFDSRVFATSHCFKPANTDYIDLTDSGVDGAAGSDGSKLTSNYLGSDLGIELPAQYHSSAAADGKKFWTYCYRFKNFRWDSSRSEWIDDGYRFIPFSVGTLGNQNYSRDGDSKATISECYAAKEAIGTNIYFNTTSNQIYADLTTCNADTTTTTGGRTQALSSEGKCYWVPEGVALDGGSLMVNKNASCSCYTGNWIKNLATSNTSWWGTITSTIQSVFTPTSVHYGVDPLLGTGLVGVTTYNSKNTLADNLTDCERAHPNRYYNELTSTCYESKDICLAVEQGFCNSGDEGKYYLGRPGLRGRAYTFDEIKNYILQCKITPLPPTISATVCASLSGATRCACATEYNPGYNAIYCAVNPTDSRCTKMCKYVSVKLGVVEPEKLYSPLALINTAADFIFWLAVVIFILNILSAGFDYVRSGDQPDKLKEASDHITGTIFGFVFILVVGGVINYIIRTLRGLGF